MRQHDRRAALMLDHLHGRLFIYEPGHDPVLSFLPAKLPKDLRDISDPDVEYTVRGDRVEQVREFYQEAIERLQSATDIVLVGPGTAKDELARWLAETATTRSIPVRTHTSAWLDEPSFELWAREKLSVPGDAKPIYVRSQEDRRRRLGGPGAPVDPEHHSRTNELKKVVHMHERRAAD